MATDRKSVLLRFPPELLDRVDEAAGVRPRSQFLLELIETGLAEFEEPTWNDLVESGVVTVTVPSMAARAIEEIPD